jgi:hypothetical protein
MVILELQRYLDIWAHASETNASKIRKSLTRFGAPIDPIDQKDFFEEGMVLQIGIAPVRIDITTKIDGVKFEEAYPNRVEINIENLIVPVISREDLILNKKASGRPQDLVDVQMLQQPPEKK